jgi:hypothetical protein
MCQFDAGETLVAMSGPGILQLFVKSDGERIDADDYVFSRVQPLAPADNSLAREIPAEVFFTKARTGSGQSTLHLLISRFKVSVPQSQTISSASACCRRLFSL